MTYRNSMKKYIFPPLAFLIALFLMYLVFVAMRYFFPEASSAAWTDVANLVTQFLRVFDPLSPFWAVWLYKLWLRFIKLKRNGFSHHIYKSLRGIASLEKWRGTLPYSFVVYVALDMAKFGRSNHYLYASNQPRRTQSGEGSLMVVNTYTCKHV